MKKRIIKQYTVIKSLKNRDMLIPSQNFIQGLCYGGRESQSQNFFFFWIFIYLFSSFFTIGIYLRILKLKFNIPNDLFLSYLSPTILLQAISLLKFFSKLEIHNNLIKNVILFLNPLNFSVILIHGRLFPANIILVKKFFNSIRNYKENVFLIIYLFGIYIYIICILFDYLRLFLFKLLKIRYFCVLIENLFKII